MHIWNKVKAELQQFAIKRYKGASVMCRSRRFLDEKPSTRALSDERETALVKEILKIQYGGCAYIDTPGILDNFFDYFRELFGSCEGHNLGLNYSCLLEAFPRHDDERRAVVETAITLDEIKAAISKMQGHKSPVHNGISSEFYRIFSHCLIPALMEVFQAPYDVDYLPPAFYSGILY